MKLLSKEEEDGTLSLIPQPQPQVYQPTPLSRLQNPR